MLIFTAGNRAYNRAPRQTNWRYRRSNPIYLKYVICGIAAALLLNVLPASADDLDDPEPRAGDDCPTLPQDIALDSVLGSAGIMKNIAEHPESIRAVAKKLLSQAVETDHFKSPPNCSGDCASAPDSLVVYKVEPTVFLPENKQDKLCLTLEDQSKKHPMKFGPRSFETLAQLNDWITEFTQGRGDDGKALYEQCGSNCSPRYTFYIAKDDAELTIDADVLCGLARDRKSEDYLVSTAIRWRCPKP